MPDNISRTWQVTLAGFAAIGAASLIIAFAVAGFVTGLVFPALFVGLFAIAAMFDRTLVPPALKNPTRDEWMVFGSVALLIAGTAVAAAFMNTYAWVAIPMAGFLAIHSLYGLNQLNQQYPIAPEPELAPAAPGVHSPPEVIMGDWFETLSKVDIFGMLTPEGLRDVAALGVIRMVREGSALGVEGQRGAHTYVILTGHAQLSAYSRVGRITARVAGPGESLPLASILGDGTLITSIQARSDMTVWEVDSDRLRAFFESRPDVAAQVYCAAATILAERYRSTLRRLTEQSAEAMKSEHFWVNV
jgi:hypothetical protein